MTDTRPAPGGVTITPTELRRLGRTTLAGTDIDAGVSIIALQDQRAGYGPALHQHPYREIFVIHAGQAEFTVGDRTTVAGAGDVLVVPPHTPHKFRVVGDEPYTATDIHESPELITIWLEDPDAGDPDAIDIEPAQDAS